MQLQSNKILFTGVLAYIGTPSNKPPSGARGHRVLLTSEAALEALPTLPGCNVNYTENGHRIDLKHGIIEEAVILDDMLVVSGYLYKDKLSELSPELIPHLEANAALYGMSYELIDAHVSNLRAEIWELTKVTFVGAAVLLKHCAAYENTTFCISTKEAL